MGITVHINLALISAQCTKAPTRASPPLLYSLNSTHLRLTLYSVLLRVFHCEKIFHLAYQSYRIYAVLEEHRRKTLLMLVKKYGVQVSSVPEIAALVLPRYAHLLQMRAQTGQQAWCQHSTPAPRGTFCCAPIRQYCAQRQGRLGIHGPVRAAGGLWLSVSGVLRLEYGAPDQ